MKNTHQIVTKTSACVFRKTQKNGFVSALCALSLMATVPAFAGTVYRPGLLQGKFNTSADKTSDPATATVTDRVPGTVMADVLATESNYATQVYSNAWTDVVSAWNRQNTTFAYAGEMWLESGTTYTFGKYLDDGASVKIETGFSFEHGTHNTFGTGAYTATRTGWHTFEARAWDGTGGKGPMGDWEPDLGLGVNTIGTTTAKPKEDWAPLRDPGDMSVFRTRTQDAFTRVDSVQENGTDWTLELSVNPLPSNAELFVVFGATDAGMTSPTEWEHAVSIGTLPGGAASTPSFVIGASNGVDLDSAAMLLYLKGTAGAGMFEEWVPFFSETQFNIAVGNADYREAEIQVTGLDMGYGVTHIVSVGIEIATDDTFANIVYANTDDTGWNETPFSLAFDTGIVLHYSTTYYVRAVVTNNLEDVVYTDTISFTTPTPNITEIFWSNTGTDFNDAGSFTNAFGFPQAPESTHTVYFPSVAITQPVLTQDLTIKGLAFRKNASAEVGASDGFDCCDYVFTAENGAALTLSNSGNNLAIVYRTKGTNVVDVPIVFHAQNNAERKIDGAYGTLVLNNTMSTLGSNNTLTFNGSYEAVVRLAGDNTGFDGGASFRQNLHVYVENPSAVLTMKKLQFYSWAATATKTIYLYNATGAPLDFTLPAVTASSIDTLSFNDAPFMFSNTVWNCEFNSDKPMTFNTHVVISNFVSVSSQVRGLAIQGTGMLEVLDAFCADTSRTNYVIINDGVYKPRKPEGLPRTSFNRIGNKENGTPRLALFADFPGDMPTDAVRGGFVSGQHSTGFAAYGGDRTVRFNDGAVLELNKTVPSSSSWYTISRSGKILSFGAADSDGTVCFDNPIDISGGKHILAFKSNAAVDVKFLGELSRAAAAETRIYYNKTGCEGTIELAAHNTYGISTTETRVHSYLRGGRLLVSGSITNHTLDIGQSYYSYDKTLYENSVLGGTGAIFCNVNVYSNSFVCAGDQNAAGTLTIGTSAFDTLPGSLILKQGAGLRTRVTNDGNNLLKLTGGFSSAKKATYKNDGLAYIDVERSADLLKTRGRVKIVDWSEADPATCTIGFDADAFVAISSDPDFIAGHVSQIDGDGLYLTYQFVARHPTTLIIR